MNMSLDLIIVYFSIRHFTDILLFTSLLLFSVLLFVKIILLNEYGMEYGMVWYVSTFRSDDPWFVNENTLQ